MLAVMDKQFGLGFLLRTYLGIGSNVVRPIQRHDRKSIGAERSVSSFRPFEVRDETTKKPSCQDIQSPWRQKQDLAKTGRGCSGTRERHAEDGLDRAHRDAQI